MDSAFPNNTYHLPVYRKALEIFKISRAMAAYFSDDKHVIEMDFSANPRHYQAGSLVTESLQLAPGIASAACAPNSESRLQRVKNIKAVAKNLKHLCRKLEGCGVKEVEFLNLLRKEIHLFDKMVSDWFQNHKT
ncbi:MAG: hypothetical protein RI572_05180 [Salegentibacter sp.]|uniref:Four helix bundle protein n=1 Tax=Salegentibacter flavus TaxID=287099 RepID=A0A1I4ZET1_9FLAO|nr:MULTISPECIES: hypothetical protein [Salegentibacter]MDR9456785.1 hypothetical protein [Salegentibacter sp.]SFN48776.1 hypothetical protein SAMN05660413_01286 [Salegentibacter flavus]